MGNDDDDDVVGLDMLMLTLHGASLCLCEMRWWVCDDTTTSAPVIDVSYR
jgi:hypothetical protein